MLKMLFLYENEIERRINIGQHFFLHVLYYKKH